jgi:flagellar FliJ protein
MKKFNFRLQRVIEVREIKKKQCQKDLANSQEELTRREKLLEEASQEAQASSEGLRQALMRATKAGHLITLDRWRNRQKEEVEARTIKTEEQRQEVDRKRAVLILAAKDKKALDRLKERRLEEYRGEMLQEEQAYLDELGGRRSQSWKRELAESEMD